MLEVPMRRVLFALAMCCLLVHCDDEPSDGVIPGGGDGSPDGDADVDVDVDADVDAEPDGDIDSGNLDDAQADVVIGPTMEDCTNGVDDDEDGATDCADDECIDEDVCASCDDGRLNRDETDVDCGGTYCLACSLGDACQVNQDCVNNLCLGDVCRLPRDCQDLHDTGGGETTDGIYEIDPDGAGDIAPYEVYCDMTTDGGGWTLVFHHNYSEAGVFASDAQVGLSNADDPSHDRYSILDNLDHFRRDGRFTFRMNWPGYEGRNIWAQENSPFDGAVEGYVPFSLDVVGNFWGGLRARQNAEGAYLGHYATIDGSLVSDAQQTSYAYYGIGTKRSYGTHGTRASTVLRDDSGVLAANGTAPTVELWVKPGPPVVCGDEIVARPWETCEDGNTENGDGCSARCVTETYERSCADILGAGLANGDGLYLADVSGSGVPMPVLCDMTTDGGGWTLVLNQDMVGGPFNVAGRIEPLSANMSNPLANKYSNMIWLGDFERGGGYVFRLEWPGRGRNIWYQTTNPTTSTMVDNYREVVADAPDWYYGSSPYPFRGLELSSRSHSSENRDFIDSAYSSHRSHSVAVSTVDYPHGLLAAPGVVPDLPYPHYTPTSSHTRLWVRPGPECGDGTLTHHFETCDDGNLDDGDGCSGQCARETTEVSCLAILDSDGEAPSGPYVIDPAETGAPTDVTWCDMTTDGGGWTLVMRTVWDWSETRQLWTQYDRFRGDTTGSPSTGQAYRLAGQHWPALQSEEEHLLVVRPRNSAQTECSPLHYAGSAGVWDVPADGTATLTGFVPVRSPTYPYGTGYNFFNGTTELLTRDSGSEGFGSCSTSSYGVPWLYGEVYSGSCCQNCPAILGEFWSDEPHPVSMLNYGTNSWDSFGSNLGRACWPWSHQYPNSTTSYYRYYVAVDEMEYFIR
jgi:cysteine-rich repeat protein